MDIAVGKSRRETSWKNKEITWGELVAKLSKTHRTAETHAEYLQAKKDRQSEIKDIGGFVGGYIHGGRRNPSSVLHRQIISLDLDFSSYEFWQEFELVYSCAACMYSTHKHSPSAPRYRLVLPLDREVTAAEYIAISRRIAGELGINNFDDTTFQPERLMYWPSTSSDGEFVFESQEGEELCADEVLASYVDWKDASAWPVSDRVGELVLRDIKKQGDPLEKAGAIGAFCRAYDIHEAIEKFLEGVYVACDVKDRYTYTQGSASAGVITYDDKFAYSHHGTDPASLKLCNAFDLVRLHLFGIQDENADKATPVNRLPSYKAMLEFVAADSKAKSVLGAERLRELREEFGEVEEVEDLTWLEDLEADGKMNYKSTIENIILILENDSALKGRFALDTFEQREIVCKDLPWRKLAEGRYVVDIDESGLRWYLEKAYKITGEGKIRDAFGLVTQKNSVHPVKEYLKSLVWDGVKRLDSLFIDYLGAEDSEYTRAVTRKSLTAAVRRVKVPGVKFDTVLTFTGPEGVGKSTILDKLGGAWFSDSFGGVEGKEAFEQIQGVWLMEVAELAGMKSSDFESVKHFISKRSDRYRVPYGRRIEEFPRQVVFFGTTNNAEFLRDPTGNRRFWPVAVNKDKATKSVFEHLTAEEVGQVWAEAVQAEKNGEKLYLQGALELAAKAKQTEHREEDEKTGSIRAFLDMKLPANWHNLTASQRVAFRTSEDDFAEVFPRDRVSVMEIWVELFRGKQSDLKRADQTAIHSILRNIEGWESRPAQWSDAEFGRKRGFWRVHTACTPL